MRKYLNMLGRVGFADTDGIEIRSVKYAANLCFFATFSMALFYAAFGSVLSGSLNYAVVSFGVAIGYGISIGLSAI